MAAPLAHACPYDFWNSALDPSLSADDADAAEPRVAWRHGLAVRVDAVILGPVSISWDDVVVDGPSGVRRRHRRRNDNPGVVITMRLGRAGQHQGCPERERDGYGPHDPVPRFAGDKPALVGIVPTDGPIQPTATSCSQVERQVPPPSRLGGAKSVRTPIASFHYGSEKRSLPPQAPHSSKRENSMRPSRRRRKCGVRSSGSRLPPIRRKRICPACYQSHPSSAVKRKATACGVPSPWQPFTFGFQMAGAQVPSRPLQ